ncbi:hypothetical protein K431DRAFT_128239 [Polychaeton citri CBS 116435]|uniref:F-box domain-containing protein n=1 Tax=Polychaeton citri CBS 116435 TaxID=1314669 RepID=A0A9P4ULK1_9PEZI|nr:hypothetical protein K431DRAFT_128239 [Polychaeton citri CBS 116435]
MLRHIRQRLVAALKKKFSKSPKSTAILGAVRLSATAEAGGDHSKAWELSNPIPSHPCQHPHRMDPDPEDDPFASMSDELFDELTPESSTAKVAVDFGSCQKYRHFSFDLPVECQPFPFPIFGSRSMEAYQSLPSLRLSGLKSEGRKRKTSSTQPRAKTARCPRRAQKRSLSPAQRPKQRRPPSTYLLPLPAKQPAYVRPLTFFDLPGEIRNQIYSYFAMLGPDPIEARFRHVLVPRKTAKARTKHEKLVRRYPQEPHLAAVNHQLRDEVLSMFYSENRFTFARSSGRAAKSTTFDMTSARMIQHWGPKTPTAAVALNHVEIRFVAPAPWSLPHVSFSIAKTPSGSLEVKQTPLMDLFCNCLEERMARELIPSMMRANGKKMPHSICQVATFLATKREGSLCASGKSTKCKTCQQKRLLKGLVDDDDTIMES